MLESEFKNESCYFSEYIPSIPQQKNDCFSKDECDYLLNFFNNNKDKKYSPGLIGDIYDKNIRSVDTVDLSFTSDNEFIYKKIIANCWNTNNHWWNFQLSGIEQQFQIGKYTKSKKGKYVKHVDVNQTQRFTRKLSVVIQLTDSNKYEGGDTFLYYKKDPERICKEKGSMTIFPSYTLHEVTEITKGTRFALFGWIYGPFWK